jgi:hypothetical protein
MGLGGTSGCVVRIVHHVLPCKAYIHIYIYCSNCTPETILLTWSNTSDVALMYLRPKRAMEVVVGRLGAREGP